MSFEYDPATDLRHWPTPMKRFGVNPYGENLYRIVLTTSRRHLVGGCWPDGEVAYHWVQKYRMVKAAWILERWNSPLEFTRMSKTQWDTTMIDPVSGWLLLGPYPARGEYDLAWEFDQGVAADSLDNIIGALERGRSRSFQDCRDTVAAEYAQEDKDQRRESGAEIRDCLRAFGNAPISAGRFGRGTKTAPELRSAEELGLPVPQQRRPANLPGLTSTMFTIPRR